MGKDRLDFPEVITRLDELDDKAELMRLNEILLRACANEPSKRYADAGEFHADLLRLENGLAPARRGRWPLWAGLCVILLFASFVGARLLWHPKTRAASR